MGKGGCMPGLLFVIIAMYPKERWVTYVYTERFCRRDIA